LDTISHCSIPVSVIPCISPLTNRGLDKFVGAEHPANLAEIASLEGFKLTTLVLVEMKLPESGAATRLENHHVASIRIDGWTGMEIVLPVRATACDILRWPMVRNIPGCSGCQLGRQASSLRRSDAGLTVSRCQSHRTCLGRGKEYVRSQFCRFGKIVCLPAHAVRGSDSYG